MKFEKKRAGAKQEIPTSAMPDIIFMLLLFFMVATTMREQQIMVKFELPEAKAIEKIANKRLVSYIWVGNDQRIQIDDALVKTEDVQSIMHQKAQALPSIVVSLRADVYSKMGIVTDIQQSLRKAYCRKLNYSARLKL